MKIAIDARILQTSTGRYVRKLLEYLQEIDQENTYYILLIKKDFDTWQPTSQNFHKVLADVAQYSVGEQITLLHLLNKLKCDLVHFTMPQQPVLYRGKTITTIHDLTLVRYKNENNNPIYSLKHGVFQWLFKRVAKKSNMIITPTNFVKSDLEAYMNHKNAPIVVTYESADKITVSPAPIEHLANNNFIMYVGQTAPYKNLNALIDAYQLLLDKHPALHLVIAGKLDEQGLKLTQYAQDKKLGNVHFPGFVSDAQLRWLYEHTTAYVFPSLSEGFGLPGLEAMQYGRPIISSNATCLPEVYQHAAHYFNPNDTRDMADKIDEVLSDSNLQNRLVANGTKLLTKYSWKHMAQETLKAYTQAVSEK